VLQPPVVLLPAQIQDPTRHRHRYPDRVLLHGQLTDEREHHFGGRFACERYAAARRRTSFSCSSNRIRRLASRSSTDSCRPGSGLPPPSRSALASQFVRQVSEIPKSEATCLKVTPSSRDRATRTTSSRNSRG